MRWLVLGLLLLLPAASAVDIGGFELDDGKIVGTYMPAGLEGTISCYENDNHIMDVVYRNDSIEISIHYFDALDKIISRNPFLKDELERALMEQAIAPINISGTSSFNLEYGGCTIELHDIPTRFFRVICDKIVITGLDYTVNQQKENVVKLERDNFSATLFSDTSMEVSGNNITAYGNLMLVSFSYVEEKEIEHAFINKTIGGEITINGYSKNLTDYVSYFGNISVVPEALHRGKIVLSVTGEDKSGGKIVKINLGKDVCICSDFSLSLDGREIKRASNFNDILDPDDDGLEPEYYVLSSVYGDEGMFLLVTIPHFSEHQLIIQFMVENTAARTAAIFLGFLVIALASFYMFKK